jgi:hypothetical protein
VNNIMVIRYSVDCRKETSTVACFQRGRTSQIFLANKAMQQLRQADTAISWRPGFIVGDFG